MEIDIIGKYEKKIFYNVPDHLLPLASGVTPARKAEAGAVPKAPKAWELSASFRLHYWIFGKAGNGPLRFIKAWERR